MRAAKHLKADNPCVCVVCTHVCAQVYRVGIRCQGWVHSSLALHLSFEIGPSCLHLLPLVLGCSYVLMHPTFASILRIWVHVLMLAQQALCSLSPLPNYWMTSKDRREKREK